MGWKWSNGSRQTIEVERGWNLFFLSLSLFFNLDGREEEEEEEEEEEAKKMRAP